jgi:hypothetical protein
MVDLSELKVVNLPDYSFYAIIVPKDGVVIDFEECKVKVKEGDILYIRDYKICKSNKLDKFIKTIDEKNKSRVSEPCSDCISCGCESK